MKDVPSPLIYSPLKIIPELKYFLDGSKSYLSESKVCRDLLSLKRKELAFVLSYYYSDYDLASLVHPLSKYTTTFEYFILQNYKKVKTVEELAQLGGYTVSTLRRIFNNVFHEPVYEWMQARRKEGILDDLNNSEYSISEICYKYGFDLCLTSPISVRSSLELLHVCLEQARRTSDNFSERKSKTIFFFVGVVHLLYIASCFL